MYVLNHAPRSAALMVQTLLEEHKPVTAFPNAARCVEKAAAKNAVARVFARAPRRTPR